MALKLNSSGGGSVTIDPVSTASNVTISIPATNAGSLVTADSSGNITPTVNNTQALGAVGNVWSNVHATTFTGALTGNASTSNTFLTTRTNYKGVTDAAVAGQLMWKHYGNNHTIFDASNSTSPQGGAVNNTNSASAWAATYPTLMGWNGTSTYGVRVDACRVADLLSTAPGNAPSYAARAWVNFNGAAAGTDPGGTVTVTRTAGSTICNCTSSSPHGLITGNIIYASYSSVITPPFIPGGTYSVTVTGANTFTFVNAQTTAITSGTLVISTSSMRGEGNISCVSDIGVGNYLVNFSTEMVDTNYAVLITLGWGAFASNAQNDAMPFIGEQTVYYFKIYVQSQPDGTFDPTFISAAIFR